MYLRHLTLRNLKLARALDLDFTRRGAPRPFTVFVGENGRCKTALLQAIALAASGPDRANQLADAQTLPDVRDGRATTRSPVKSWATRSPSERCARGKAPSAATAKRRSRGHETMWSTELLDQYREHVNLHVRPRVERVRDAMQRERPGQGRIVFEAWSTMLRELLRRPRPFVGLSYDAIDQLIPAREREEWRLELPAHRSPEERCAASIA